MPPVITALYAAFNALFNLFLAYEVTRARNRYSVSLGAGEHPGMLVAIRAHGNNAEFVPLALVMLLVCELCGGSRPLLHALGGALLIARIAHWYGLPRKAPNPYRFMGVVITMAMIATCAGYALYLHFKLV